MSLSTFRASPIPGPLPLPILPKPFIDISVQENEGKTIRVGGSYFFADYITLDCRNLNDDTKIDKQLVCLEGNGKWYYVKPVVGGKKYRFAVRAWNKKHDEKWAEITETAKEDGVLEEMKIIADKHIKYSQAGDRSTDTDKGWEALDCSELVMRYLHKLGVLANTKSMSTADMVSQEKFRKAIGNNNIDFVSGSDKKDFIPQKGDIFVWRRSDGVGHTGIVYDYDAEKDLVTIIEAIGSIGSADETTNKNKGGDSKTGCTRTAIYKRTGGALSAHKGWIGYYRPKNYSKSL